MGRWLASQAVIHVLTGSIGVLERTLFHPTIIESGDSIIALLPRSTAGPSGANRQSTPRVSHFILSAACFAAVNFASDTQYAA